jgi:hypothetical protein
MVVKKERIILMNIQHKDTVYIVSGYMRTGTSMMMGCLEAGGMEASYKKSRDEMRQSFSDKHYDPNEGGLYELEASDYRSADFPDEYKGKLIKCLMGGIERIKVMPKIKIVFMRRDITEIAQSYEAFFGIKSKVDRLNFQSKVDNIILRLRKRNDVDINVFWYRDVVEDPIKHFDILKNNSWPIDIKEAVKFVKPKLLRFKKEILKDNI